MGEVGTALDPGNRRARGKPPAWRTAIELLALLSVSDGAVANWGGGRTSWRAALDLEPSLPNPGSVRAHRSFSPRAYRAGASRACSRISTGGPDARGGRAALGAAAQAARPSSRRKLLTDSEPGLLGRCAVRRARGEAASSALDSRTRRWTIRGEPRSSIASSTARFAPTTLSHRFAVRHARLDAARQAHDVAELSSSL